tara:strand:+ start:96988 stop:97197 length:210 start_codon:yes stop_codon:yes gene_type:complete
MNKVNLGKGYVEVREVKQLSNKSIRKGEVFTTVERTIWKIDQQLWIKYKGHDLRVYPFPNDPNYYRATL